MSNPCAMLVIILHKLKRTFMETSYRIVDDAHNGESHEVFSDPRMQVNMHVLVCNP
jgi:hypothetical protein